IADYQASIAYFQYGRSQAYDSMTPVQNILASGSDVTISAPITPLWANTDYHYRIIAINLTGTTISADQIFTTLPSTHPGGGNVPPVAVDDIALTSGSAVAVNVLLNDT